MADKIPITITANAPKVFIVGQNKPEYHERAWEFAGVFSSQDKAIAACRDASYWWAEVTLNEAFAHESSEFSCYGFPIKDSCCG